MDHTSVVESSPTKTSRGEPSEIVLASQVDFAGVCGRGGHTNASSVEGETFTGRRNETHANCETFVRSKEILLPGIPDDITLELITPKLTCRALCALSCVSPSWQEAIRTNLVYEARVRANSTETLVVHRHHGGGNGYRDTVALYSASERCCYDLPPNPYLPILCEFVALDGKLYALGGDRTQGKAPDDSCREVYVLDLARHRKWKRCASMLHEKSFFGCGVMDKKIYVFGLTFVYNSATGRFQKVQPECEVYDSQEDAWSPIMPMPLTRCIINENVASIGKELFTYSVEGRTLGVYDTAKNDWRLVESFWGNMSIPFIRKEEFYSFSLSGIDKYDVEQKTWVNLHTNSFPTVQLDGSNLLDLSHSHVWAGKDELFVWVDTGDHVHSFQCKGLDSEKKELVWQETNCSLGKALYADRFIQL